MAFGGKSFTDIYAETIVIFVVVLVNSFWADSAWQIKTFLIIFTYTLLSFWIDINTLQIAYKMYYALLVSSHSSLWWFKWCKYVTNRQQLAVPRHTNVRANDCVWLSNWIINCSQMHITKMGAHTCNIIGEREVLSWKRLHLSLWHMIVTSISCPTPIFPPSSAQMAPTWPTRILTKALTISLLSVWRETDVRHVIKIFLETDIAEYWD